MTPEKPRLKHFIELLRTLADQSFVDVEPDEREPDLTPMYDFLVTSGMAGRALNSCYWLTLINEDGCLMLADLLESLSKEGG